MSTSLKITSYTFIKMIIVLGLLLTASIASAASLSLSPATGVYGSGQTFSVRVLVNTSGSSINAADGTISFNANELSVVSVAKGSIFNLWTAEPAFSNSAGTITFSGGTPTGYTGGAGTVLTVTFRAKGSGPSKVNFANGSVLAADGRGTNVLTSMGGGNYTISAATAEPAPEVIIEYVPPANTPKAPVVTSATHPDPEGWYRETTAELAWELPSGVTAVRTLLDSAPSSIPAKVYDSPIDSITLEDLEEGEQYFHIQFQNADGWGSVTHYRLAIDISAPTDLKLTLAENNDPASPQQIIAVEVAEEVSSVDTYQIQLNGGEPFTYIHEMGSSTIVLNDLAPGHYTAIVEAFDQAGNSVIGNLSFTVLAFDKPVFTDYPNEINEEVIPVIKGQTRSGSAVTVTITKVDSGGEAPSEQVYEVVADEAGVFTVIPGGTFPLGVYELVAVATDKNGAQSDPSDPARIAVQHPGYIQFGSLAISVLSVFIPLLALLAVAVFGVWYFFALLRRTRRGVTKEAKEALAIVAKEFNSLEAELQAHKQELIDSRKTKKLTKTEATVLEALSTSLRSSRKRVAKEITDVEDLVE